MTSCKTSHENSGICTHWHPCLRYLVGLCKCHPYGNLYSQFKTVLGGYFKIKNAKENQQ
nr:MAG TPA: hypothetical protein [Caudoviricetes sp.]